MAVVFTPTVDCIGDPAMAGKVRWVKGLLNLGTGYATGGMPITWAYLLTRIGTVLGHYPSSNCVSGIVAGYAGPSVDGTTLYKWDQTAGAMLAYSLMVSPTVASAGTLAVPEVVTQITDAGLVPVADVVTLSQTSVCIQSVDVRTVGGGAVTGAYNLQWGAAPANSRDARIVDATHIAFLPGDLVATVDVTYMYRQTAGSAGIDVQVTAGTGVGEWTAGTDLSNANKSFEATFYVF